MARESVPALPATASMLRVVPRLARLMDRELQRSGVPLSVRQVRVLQRLRDGEQVAAQIARDNSVGPAAMQGVLDGLVERGFVVRERSPADRRKQLLQLTGEGEAALATGTSVLMHALGSLAEGLSMEEQGILALALDLLQGAIDRYVARQRLRQAAPVREQ